jgi:hypothetical protein
MTSVSVRVEIERLPQGDLAISEGGILIISMKQFPFCRPAGYQTNVPMRLSGSHLPDNSYTVDDAPAMR